MNEKSRRDFIDLLSQCTEKNRKTTMGVVGDRVSRDHVNYVKEELQFMAPDMTPREVTLVVSTMCDCGKLLSQKNVLQGRCQHPGCTRYVCSDCSRVCRRCERTVCSQHSKLYGDGEIYCNRCRPLKWLKLFFDVGGKEKEK